MVKRNKKNTGIVKGIILFVITALLYNFVWNVYVVNPTASAALDNEEGKQVVLMEIDKRQSIGVLKLEGGYHAYALSEGFWGWSITDDSYLANASNGEDFVAKRETFALKGNREAEVFLITTQIEQISYFLAYDENKNEIYFDTIRDEGGELHYAYSEKPLSGEITYEHILPMANYCIGVNKNK